MGDRYNPLFELGAGAFGKAWVVKDNVTQKKHVSKVIQIKGLSSAALDRCLTEVTVLSACSHVNIVRYIEAFVNDGSLHIIMEYAAGGDLQQKIDKQNGVKFPSETVIDWFLQVVLALEYIHKRNILHRDLKPQNIFLTDNGIVKLGDFGIARVLNDCDDLALTRIGTPLYISPEICERKPYNSSSDMWAAGCLLYQMCLLRVPFQACNFEELTKKIVQVEYEPIPRYFSPLITRMITGLLVVNPNDRLTASALLSLEDASKMLMYVKKKNLAVKNGHSSRSRSNSLVTRRSRMKVDHKIRASSVDRNHKNVPEKQNLKPRVINAEKVDEFDRIKKDAESGVTNKRNQTLVTSVRNGPDKKKEADVVDSVNECSDRHKVDYSKHEGCIKTNAVMSENDKTIEAGEKPQSGRKFSKHDEEPIMKGKTYTLRDSYMKKLSNASPILAKTICKQRFSLSISEPEALNAGKNLTEVTDQAAAAADVDDVDDEEDVFSSPCPKPKSRLKINSLTYNIYDKGNANNNNSSSNNSSSNNYTKCDDVDGKLHWINNSMLQALSAVKFNKELSKNILLDEIICKLGQERCDYLLRLINVHIIEKGQSVQSLNYFVKGNELTSIPLIAMYLSLQSTESN